MIFIFFLDASIFGVDHFYDDPTCVPLYNCIAYDPEGLLGSLSACILTYFGILYLYLYLIKLFPTYL
jgi:hypothetical protein